MINEWQREEVKNETRARDVNESIEAATDVLGELAATDADVFRCECGDATCEAVIGLNRAEYEAVRAEATWFAIAIDHENPELDRVVTENDRFTVVEKWLREAAGIARRTNPRTVDSQTGPADRLDLS